MDDLHELLEGASDIAQGMTQQVGGKRPRWGKFDLKFHRFLKADKSSPTTDGKYKVKVVSSAAYQKALAGGAKKGEYGAEYVVLAEATELGAQYDYERAVALAGPDMKHIFLPSVLALMGKDIDVSTLTKEQIETLVNEAITWLAGKRGQYIYVEDVPSVDWDGKEKKPGKYDKDAGKWVEMSVEDGGKQQYTARVMGFMERAEAQDAHTARWGSTGNGNGAKATSTLPYSADDWAAIEAKDASGKVTGYTREQWTSIVERVDDKNPGVKARLARGEKVQALAKELDIEAKYIALLKGDDSQVPA